MRKYRKIIVGNKSGDNIYKGKRVRFPVRMPVALYYKLIDQMHDDESLNDFVVRHLEEIVVKNTA